MTFFLSACATTTPKPLVPDLDLVKPYTYGLEDKRPKMFPYVATFSKYNKTLFYVAAEHVSTEKYPDLMKHPTFLTIQDVFNSHQIDAIIVEGITPWVGDLPKNLLSHGEECEKSGYKINCGESWFAIQLARKKNAKIYTGEPFEEEIFTKIKGAGYSVEDLLGFYVVRQIPEWKREGEFSAGSARKLIEQLLMGYNRTYHQTGFDYEAFIKWYESHAGNSDFNLVTTNTTAPVSDRGSNFFQKMASQMDVERNRTIVLRIAEALNQYSNVLVVYGASHLLVEREALGQMLSKPEFSKPY